MQLHTYTGTITGTSDLSSTAKEVTITLATPAVFPAGSFINLFKEVDGVRIRRAFSVAGSTESTLTLAIRHTPTGVMTPEFWHEDIIGQSVEVMGPMGKNTSDKLTHPRAFLFAFGIGAGVIKAILDSLLQESRMTEITVVTGSRNEADILYKEYFDAIAEADTRIHTRYVLSDPLKTPYPYTGYIQNHIDDYIYDDADIYVCGQVKACEALIAQVNTHSPQNISFHIEAFH